MEKLVISFADGGKHSIYGRHFQLQAGGREANAACSGINVWSTPRYVRLNGLGPDGRELAGCFFEVPRDADTLQKFSKMFSEIAQEVISADALAGLDAALANNS